MTVPQLTEAQVLANAGTAMGNTHEYDQDSVWWFGLDGLWRCDCSGFTCAIAGLPQGIDCPSTYELRVGGYTSAPIARSQIVPGRTITLVSADEDGGDFGHVALVVDYNASSDQIEIQEHGGGVGPIRRWLDSGIAYDSSAEYGHYRPFKLYNLTNVGNPTPPPVPPTPTPEDDFMSALTDQQQEEMYKVIHDLGSNGVGSGQTSVGSTFAAILGQLQQNYNQSNKLKGAVLQAIAKGGTPDQVASAVVSILGGSQ